MEVVEVEVGSGPQILGCEEKPLDLEKQTSEVSDVSMEEGISEIDKSNEVVNGDAMDNPTCGSLSKIPGDVSPPILPSPAPSVSPRLSVTRSRKSVKSSPVLTASQKDVQSTTEHLAASIHRGLEIIECQRQSSAFRTSPLRFSVKTTELKTVLPLPKIDVGIQTLPRSPEEDCLVYVCSNCKNSTLIENENTDTDPSNLQLVPVECVDNSLSAEKPMKQVPKAVEKVLRGAIRRKMALEDYCAKQNYEIAHLNRLVQQYKHEREYNAIIAQMREDKIIRLENLMDGVLPFEDFMEEELICIRKEHEEKYDNHPEILETRIELKRAQDELEKLRNFFDMGEKEVLMEEIHDLRSQLQYYTDNSPKTRQQKSLLQLTYPCEPSSSTPLNPIPEVNEESVSEKLEQEKWAEIENQWMSLADELKTELESSQSHARSLQCELEAEKKCSEELKGALELAMQAHARILEQYADLEEKYMQLLARNQKDARRN